MKGFDKMKKKNYYLVCKYPFNALALRKEIRTKICKGAKGSMINYFGDSTINLGKMSYVKSLWVSFRIGMVCNKYFINTDDIQIMVENS